METIAAIATAQSPSAIGIVRLSGEETRRVLAALGALGDFLGKNSFWVFVHNDGVDLTQWGKEHKATGIDLC